MRWLTAAILALMLAGCGGGSDSDSKCINPPRNGSNVATPC